MSSSAQRMPEHHAPPEDLLAYATGTADPWLETLVACHLTLCPQCRQEVDTLDALGGILMSEAAAGAGEAALASGGPGPLSTPPVPASVPRVRRDLVLPRDLQSVVPRPLHPHLRDRHPRFRFSVPGVKQIALTLTGGGRPVQLVRFAPGYAVPEHGHAGLEWLMVLSGHLRDGATGEVFHRGDVSLRDTEHVHTQHIGEEEPCIAVFATLGPPLPRTFLGKLLARAVGL